MNSKVKGFVAGVLAAIFYGTNPLGAVYLYQDDINSASVLFYRYGSGVLRLVDDGEGRELSHQLGPRHPLCRLRRRVRLVVDSPLPQFPLYGCGHCLDHSL